MLNNIIGVQGQSALSDRERRRPFCWVLVDWSGPLITGEIGAEDDPVRWARQVAMQPAGRSLKAAPRNNVGHISALVSETAGARDHQADRIELMPLQRFVLLQVLVEGQPVEA